MRENDIKITRKGTSRCDVDEASFTYTHGDTYLSLIHIYNKLYDETPLIGLTFKKIDSKTKKQIYDGAKFNVYYIENDVDGSKGLSPIDSQEAKRVYLGVYCYKTNTSTKNKFYETKTYNGITYNLSLIHI